MSPSDQSGAWQEIVAVADASAVAQHSRRSVLIVHPETVGEAESR